uniref:Uncharacterized protein n=1 Tax=Anopheles maculatus TaxID=74869 RepID=A0A182TCL8_9DIPT
LSPHIANEAPSSNLISSLQQRSQQQQQQLLQSKLSNISLASSSSSSIATAAAGTAPPPVGAAVATTFTPTSSSSSPAASDPRRSPSPQAYYLAKMQQPKSAITSTSVIPVAATGGLERNGSLEPARKYKHSPFLSRRTASEYGNGSPKKESTLSSLGQSIFKNFTTSPFAQRKSVPPGESKLASASPPMPVSSANIYANGGGAGSGSSSSNPSSPLLLLRKAQHDGSDTDTQYKHLHGNTSPIVLQRFYHQQNQLIEQQREALHQQQQQQVVYGYSSPSPVPSATDASPRPSRYSPLPSHRTVHHGVHPVLSNTTLPHQSAIPLYVHHEPVQAGIAPLAASGIPVYQQSGGGTVGSPKHKSSFFNTFSRGMKSAGRGDKVIDRGGTTAPTLLAGDRPLYATTITTTGQTMYHHQQQPPVQTSAAATMLHRHGPLG